MKWPSILDYEGAMLVEALQELGARDQKRQKTHHATRSSGIEEHGYRKSEDFSFEAVGERSTIGSSLTCTTGGGCLLDLDRC